MVKIIGNVEPRDDYTHPLGPEKNFNESVYFNFFDRQLGRGGFLRIGNRANEGYAEVTVVVYEPGGAALFDFGRPKIAHNDAWNAGGLAVEVLVPGEKLRTTFDGQVLLLADPRAMADPGRAFKESPKRRLTLDLIHEGVGPIYGWVGTATSTDQFTRSHYEQHMRVSGTLSLDGGPALAIAGHGLRDHSWGPRYWQSTPSYRWITGNFGDDLGMLLSVIGGRKGGVLQRGDELIPVVDVDLETDYEPGTKFHRSLRARVKLANGEEHQVVGTVKGFIPLRNRRSGMSTHIGEGMTEYVLDGDRVGYGLSEYLDQPPEAEGREAEAAKAADA